MSGLKKCGSFTIETKDARSNGSQISSNSKKSTSTTDVVPPKRPMNAYNVFYREERMKLLGPDAGTSDEIMNGYTIKKKRPHRKGKGEIPLADMAKHVGRKWKELTKHDMDRYRAMAKADMERYRRDMIIYKKFMEGKKKIENCGEGGNVGAHRSADKGESSNRGKCDHIKRSSSAEYSSDIATLSARGNNKISNEAFSSHIHEAESRPTGECNETASVNLHQSTENVSERRHTVELESQQPGFSGCIPSSKKTSNEIYRSQNDVGEHQLAMDVELHPQLMASDIFFTKRALSKANSSQEEVEHQPPYVSGNIPPYSNSITNVNKRLRQDPPSVAELKQEAMGYISAEPGVKSTRSPFFVGSHQSFAPFHSLEPTPLSVMRTYSLNQLEKSLRGDL